MFVSPRDIQELTDYEQPAKQKEWLLKNGFRFVVGASGRPKVLQTELERVLFGGVKSKTYQPNFESING